MRKDLRKYRSNRDKFLPERVKAPLCKIKLCYDLCNIFALLPFQILRALIQAELEIKLSD